MHHQKVLVKKILENAQNYEWSIQGLGMLRLYLSDTVRLHVWDKRYMVPNVSEIHTHPWNYHSIVIAGALNIQRFKLAQDLMNAVDPQQAPEYYIQQLKCGVGCEFIGEKVKGNLFKYDTRVLTEGTTLTEDKNVIHRAVASNGTVTIIDRSVPEGDDPDVASVLWPVDEQWVSAEPRPATPEEVFDITSHSLQRWFADD